MRAIRISFFCFIFCFSVFGQKTDISVCRGSTSVNKNVPYALNFLGKKKLVALNLFGYCNFPNISNNYIWLNFTPNSYGNLDIVFGDKPDSLTVFIFIFAKNHQMGPRKSKKWWSAGAGKDCERCQYGHGII